MPALAQRALLCSQGWGVCAAGDVGVAHTECYIITMCVFHSGNTHCILLRRVALACRRLHPHIHHPKPEFRAAFRAMGENYNTWQARTNGTMAVYLVSSHSTQRGLGLGLHPTAQGAMGQKSPSLSQPLNGPADTFACQPSKQAAVPNTMLAYAACVWLSAQDLWPMWQVPADLADCGKEKPSNKTDHLAVPWDDDPALWDGRAVDTCSPRFAPASGNSSASVVSAGAKVCSIAVKLPWNLTGGGASAKIGNETFPVPANYDE